LLSCGSRWNRQSNFAPDESDVMKNRSKVVPIISTGIWLLAWHCVAAEENKVTIPVPRQREVAVKSFVSSEPLFVSEAKTLDPADVAHTCWKGYLTHQPDAWGMTAGLQPMLRFNFDDRLLPWPVLKHHGVDGFDNNARNMGAHALLHAMFGDEKKNDPAEAGELAYLLGCTDPDSGFSYSPDALPRNCPLGEGEEAKNVMLLYQQTKDPHLFEWAQKMIKTLQYYATEFDEPGVGEEAAYCQGGAGGQGGFTVGTPPARTTTDPSLGGWQHLYVGWAAAAFAKWYELTGDTNALSFGEALGNRLCNTVDDGDDGCFRPDGSFGGKHGASSGSWHGHSHTHCLPALTSLGEQLILAGHTKDGLRFINQASRTFDWLYDPTRNPDAGSLTGWLGEWNVVAAGWNRKTDAEGCIIGDVTQTACALGAASRSDPSLAPFVKYYDRAEQIYRGEVTEQMFRVTPQYLKVLRDCLTQRVDKEMADATPKAKSAEIEKRYQASVETAQRMVGQQLGLCGFPDWVNSGTKSDLDPDLPAVHMQGCCADATIRASYAVWSQTVTGDKKETRVNMAFNHDSPLVKVVSCLPYRGELDVSVKDSRDVMVRVPGWVQKPEVKAYVNKHPVKVHWDGEYVSFARTKSGQQLTVTYPVRMAEVREPVQGVEYTEKWRGNTIVDISPPGKYIPMYQRPEMDSEHLPE
jgi:hypothetical protein